MAQKTKGLGKGIEAILGEVAEINKPIETTKIVEKEVPADQIVKLRLIEPNREQPRKEFKEEELTELAESIRIHGVISPLIVVKKGAHYMIIAGERRWRAAKLAGLKEVPVIVKEYTDREIAEISLVENLQRSDLNPVEEALAYEKLMKEYDLTQEELADRMSKSRSAIANSLRLLRLPESVRTMVVEGKITTGHAKVLLGVSDEAAMLELAQRTVKENLSVRELEKLVKALGKAPKEKKVLQNAVAYENVENLLKEKLGTQVKIQRKSENAGRIEIDYYSLDEIERILAHIK